MAARASTLILQALRAEEQGIQLRRIEFVGGGLVEVAVELTDSTPGVKPFLRIRLDDNTIVGPDVPLSQPRFQVQCGSDTWQDGK